MKLLILLIALFAFASASVQEKGAFCTPCTMFANIMKDYLTKTDAELMELFNHICTKVPEAYADQCKTGVRAFGPSLIRTLRIQFAGEPREICVLFGLCTPQANLDAEYKAKSAIVLEKATKILTGKNDECNLAELREFYFFLPPSYQREIKSQLIGNILGQFPRLRYEVVEKLINDMFDMRVPAERVCADLDRIILPEARRRQECSQRCLDKIDLSPERLIRVITKCGLDINCYMNEVAEEMMNFQRCAHDCYMNEPFATLAL